ncbi:hypothetical protein GTQ43_00270 [Nostoc sp. KVJ3]|uniref:hypothetical protein n=1 Tax=Nostoc sp. KVJ3 TaxID=457945 RepID=UPI0022371ADF|nr:hypothetical protein [Nostoc sp. KVJ3]MCW5312341.1 hypothetical protein [Nostoc sp. KVJ3]
MVVCRRRSDTVWLRLFDEDIIDPKDTINRRLYDGLIIVKTAIYRVSCLNRTVLASGVAGRLFAIALMTSVYCFNSIM